MAERELLDDLKKTQESILKKVKVEFSLPAIIINIHILVLVGFGCGPRIA